MNSPVSLQLFYSRSLTVFSWINEMDAVLKNEMPEYVVFKSALFYCSLVIVLPVVAFFVSKWIVFDGILSLTVVSSSVCSAVCSVIVLHVTLGLFIYRACVPSTIKSVKAE